MYGINHSTGDIDSEDDDDGFSDKAALLIMSPPPPPAATYHPHNNQAADYSNYSSHDLQQQYHMMSYEYPPPPSGQHLHHHHHRPSSSLFDPADQYYSEGGLATITSNYINIPNNNNYINNNNNNNNDDYDVIKARIASHPSYPKLLNAYIDCQKVGAPPEIGVMLEEIRRRKDRVLCKHDTLAALGLDPELDDFMESYYDVLVKYKTDLSRPIDEATSFLANIQTQLANLCKDDDALSSDEELSVVEEEMPDPKARTEDRELKDRLLRRYGNHINSLKVEFSKKKKKGKLPKEARQTLLEWWSVHYKWPYPTEVDKISLAETTGLDQKQINNWFINQRKRHWKPSENMHLAMMDNLSAHFILED